MWNSSVWPTNDKITACSDTKSPGQAVYFYNQLPVKYSCARLAVTMAGIGLPAEFKKDPVRYIIRKANPVALVCLAAFLVSFTVVWKVPLQDPPQSQLLFIIVRFFDALGMVALLVFFLTVGAEEPQYIK